METVLDFIFLGSKITMDGSCSHEIKRHFLLGMKALTNLDSVFGEGNGNPLQCSCLENPRDGGAWWAAISGIEQSRTRLKQLSSSSSSVLKSRDITLPTKVHIVKVMVFPVVMYGCESLSCKEGWVPKNWCFQTVVLEKTLESPLDGKEIKPVNPKGNQPWIFIRSTDAESEALIL